MRAWGIGPVNQGKWLAISVAALFFQMGCVSAPYKAKSPQALSPASPSHFRYRLSDAHLHFVDFLQSTDGIEAALAALDRAGVDHTMINGMPVVKKWGKESPRQPLYYLEDDSPVYWYSATDVLVARAVQSLPEQSRRRFHPFITGFNGTDRNAVDHVKRMMEWYPDFWEGIGEVMAHHDDLTALTPGETARPDSISLDPVFDYAAEHDLPVSIHANIGSVWLRDPIFLSEVENMLKKHPKTRFIWCHAGISRRLVIPSLVPELRRMLRTYRNLWIDVSWVVYEDDLAPHHTPDPRWVELVSDFPTRFMIGSDLTGHFGKYTDEIQKYYLFLDALPPDVARQIGHDNFLRVLPQRVRTRLGTETESAQTR